SIAASRKSNGGKIANLDRVVLPIFSKPIYFKTAKYTGMPPVEALNIVLQKSRATSRDFFVHSANSSLITNGAEATFAARAMSASEARPVISSPAGLEIEQVNFFFESGQASKTVLFCLVPSVPSV